VCRQSRIAAERSMEFDATLQISNMRPSHAMLVKYCSLNRE
jgi:hypothetical protein